MESGEVVEMKREIEEILREVKEGGYVTRDKFLKELSEG